MSHYAKEKKPSEWVKAQPAFVGAQGKTIFDPDFDIDDSGLPHEKGATSEVINWIANVRLGSKKRSRRTSAARLLKPQQRTYSGHRGMSASGQEPTLCAATKSAYSITSSAVASRSGGTLRPNALAVLRLMTN